MTHILLCVREICHPQTTVVNICKSYLEILELVETVPFTYISVFCCCGFLKGLSDTCLLSIIISSGIKCSLFFFFNLIHLLSI